MKIKVLANLSILPDDTFLFLENSLEKKGAGAIIFFKDISVEKVIDYGFFFILLNLLNRLRISEVLNKVMPRKD